MADAETPDYRIEGAFDMRGGVWSNFARVSHSQHEFTIDFVRLDFTTQEPVEGIIVQRVNMSPLFVRQLIDTLSDNLHKYATNLPDSIIIQEDE